MVIDPSVGLYNYIIFQNNGYDQQTCCQDPIANCDFIFDCSEFKWTLVILSSDLFLQYQ